MPVIKLEPKKTPITLQPKKAPIQLHKPGVIGLPTVKKTVERQLIKYTGVIYGREKIGKTTVLASFPDTIFAMCEPGSKGIEVFEFNSDAGGITDWKVFIQMVDALLNDTTRRFKNVVIDTADRAYDMCLDYVCAELGIEYPGTDEDEKNDYGKSWRAVRQEFTHQIHRLQKADYAIWFTSHCKETTFQSKLTKDKYTRIYPSMSKQAREIIEALVDFFFYADYLTTVSGGSIRVMITEGDETIWAGKRKTPYGSIPTFLPMKDDGTAFDIIQAAFLGEDVGVPVSQLIPMKTSSETVKDFVRKEKKKPVE